VRRHHALRLEGKPLTETIDWLERYRRVREANFRRLDALFDELKARKTKR
jgi:hypothetical protein